MAPVELWVALIALAVAVVVYKWRIQPKLNLPPGPPAFPVLGNLPVLMGKNSKLPHHIFADLAKRYGPLVFLRLGSRPCIIASSPEVFKEIFRNQDQNFASRPKTRASQLLSNAGKGVGFSPYNDHWRKMRTVVTQELLTQKRVAEFESCRAAEASEMVKALLLHQKLHGTEKPVNVRLLLKALTFNVVTQMAFTRRFYEYQIDVQGHIPEGTKTPSVNDSQLKEISPEEAKEFNKLSQENIDLHAVQLIGDFIPSLSFLDRFSGIIPRMIRSHDRLHHFLSRIVEEHRKHPNEEKLDFLDLLLRVPGTDGSDQLEEIIILAVCQDIVAGGTDTTASSLEWVITELIRHPDVSAKLVAELDAVVGKERLVTEADIPKLPYLQAVVKEGMRLHPVGAISIPHETVEQSKVLGYDIPAGTMVLANFYVVHRGATYWDNPLEFCPDRFLDNHEISIKQQRFDLMPFGAGRRGCPGMSLGLISVQYVLARLYQAFEWSPPKGMKPQDLDLDEAFAMGCTKAHPLEAIPTVRLQLPGSP